MGIFTVLLTVQIVFFKDEDNSYFLWDLGENDDEQKTGEPVNVALELEHFRIQWQKELHSKQDTSQVNNNREESNANNIQLIEPTVEEQVSEQNYIVMLLLQVNGKCCYFG